MCLRGEGKLANNSGHDVRSSCSVSTRPRRGVKTTFVCRSLSLTDGDYKVLVCIITRIQTHLLTPLAPTVRVDFPWFGSCLYTFVERKTTVKIIGMTPFTVVTKKGVKTNDSFS